MTQLDSHLRSASIFAECSDEELSLVAGAVSGIRSLSDGDVVCEEDTAADRWWVVLEGNADVTAAGLYLGTVGPGETVGELALLDRSPRTATVRAVTPMELLEISGEHFLDALHASASLSLALLRQVTRRLRAADTRPTRPAHPVTRTEMPTPRSPSTPAQPAASFDPNDPGYLVDPAIHMRALRESAAVTWSDAWTSFLVTRYDDVHRLARTRTLPGSVLSLTAPLGAHTPGYRMLIRRDGDDHTRIRRLMSKAFTPRAVSGWRERAEAIVAQLLTEAAERSDLDVIADYALPLPATVITEMLGLPHDDTPQLRDWSRALTLSVDGSASPEDEARADEAGREMTQYLDDAIREKRTAPADDLLSVLLLAQESGEVLDDKEVRAQVLLLYIAGHETTLNLIGNGVAHLFRFPDQLERLRSDPTLDKNAVEEVLRFESPAQFTRRVAVEPVEIDGQVFEPGTHLTLCLASANRDPRKWGPTADAVDVARPGANEHVSFGGGAHYCLGASLARIEASVALPALVRRFPAMQPAYDELRWIPRATLRGLEELPVTLR